ncbi:patatin-like phospholipase family protein [Neobacillus sp. MER 74]|uniref:patatin-like phospholipase family protein n=1 Tax=Neobacillus sp. MER 74 TaxID=2939566 RepID=UPI00203F0703|nr:patatin-like phospholipase family protein [Neobacillus sp. MER 74]MCM3118721.1 patatin-like phospholipase family protein [Neobacillus sp. MER 74]
MSRKYRVITFDGGGVRGALSSQLLTRLTSDKKFPELIKKTDLLVGTSVGSIIALGLASGRSPQEINTSFNVDTVGEIFSNPQPGGPLTTTKYNNEGLINVLSSFFPTNLRLKDLHKRVVVPAFALFNSELGHWTPVFFNNFPGSPFLEHKVIDVAVASSAFPGFFPAFQQFIDGAMVASNPSTVGISFAVQKGKQELDKIALLSIGTGFFPYSIQKDTSEWGFLSSNNQAIGTAPNWGFIPPNLLEPHEPAVPLLTITVEGTEEADAFLSSQLLGKGFFRLDPQIPTPFQQDDVQAIPVLRTIANNTNLSEVSRFIRKYWDFC